MQFTFGQKDERKGKKGKFFENRRILEKKEK